MEELYKDIKKALPKRLDSRANVEKVEVSLRTSLSALQGQQGDDQCLQILKSGVTYLIKVLQLLLDCVPVKPQNNILSLVLDCLIAANEHGKQCSNYLLSSVTSHFMDIVLTDQFAFMSRMEVLSKVNLIFESADLAEKEKFVQMDECLAKLRQLFQLIFDIGDYEFQVCIMEFLFRLLPRKLRQKYSSDFIENQEVLQAFLAVKDGCFEVDCRNFLNHLNMTPREQNRRVFSYPCHKITFGSIELQKPNDEGYSDFWLDINLGSRRVVIFCENANLSSQASLTEDCWDTVSVWSSDIHKFVCREEGGLLHTRLDIKATARCVPSGTAFDSRPVLDIVTDPQYNIEAALAKIVGQKKVSDVAKPILFVTENVSEVHSQELDSTEEEELQKSGRGQDNSRPAASSKAKVSQSVSLSNPDVSKVKSVKVSTPTGSAVRSCSQESKWLKVSIPSDVMTTPVSTASVRSCTSSGRENIRRANTRQADITPSRKKVKTPVVTVHKPVNTSASKDTRMTTAAKLDSKISSAARNDSKMTAAARNDSKMTTAANMDTATTVSAETDTEVTSPAKRDTGITTAERGSKPDRRDNRKTLPAKMDMEATTSAKKDSRMASPAKRDLRMTMSAKSGKPSPGKMDTQTASHAKKQTRKAAKTKFVPPVMSCSGDAACAQQQIDTGQTGKKDQLQESPPNIVIPDSLPFPSQVVKPSQHGNNKKRQKRGKDADSGNSVTEKEEKQVSSSMEASATKSSKSQRSQSSQQQYKLHKSQEVTDSSHGKTLRSSQMNRLPLPSSAGDGSRPSQKPGYKASDRKKTAEPPQDTSQHKELHVDSTDSHTGSDELEMVPSSFEEFKAPKSRKTLKGQTKKAMSDCQSSKQNTHGSQPLRSTRNSQTGVVTKSQREQKMTDPEKESSSQKTRSERLQKKKERQVESAMESDDDVQHTTSQRNQLADKKDKEGHSMNSKRENSKSKPSHQDGSAKRENSKSKPSHQDGSAKRENSKSKPSHQDGSAKRENSKSKPSHQDGSAKRENSKSKPSHQDGSAKRENSKSKPSHQDGSAKRENSKSKPSHQDGSAERENSKSKPSRQDGSDQTLMASSTTDESSILSEYSSENKKQKEGTSTEKRKTLVRDGARLDISKLTVSIEKRKLKDCKENNTPKPEENHVSSSSKRKENCHHTAKKSASKKIGHETDTKKRSKNIEKHNESAASDFCDDEKTLIDSQSDHSGKVTDVSKLSSHGKHTQHSSDQNLNEDTSECEAFEFEVETNATGPTEQNQQCEGYTEDSEHSAEKLNSTKKNTTSARKKIHGSEGSTDGSREENEKELSVTVSPVKRQKGSDDKQNTGYQNVPGVDKFQDSGGDSSDQIDLIRSESEDDDTTDFRFDLDTSNESPTETIPRTHKHQCSKSTEAKEKPKETGALPKQGRAAQYTDTDTDTENDDLCQGKKTYSRKKSKGKTSVLSNACQENITVQKEKPDLVGEESINDKDLIMKGKKESKRKSKDRKTSSFSNTNQKDQSVPNTTETVSAYAQSKNSDHMTSPEQTLTQRAASPPSRSLRKRQPKSYRESDSLDDLCLNDNNSVYPNQSLSRSVISDRKFLFSKSEKRKPNGEKFVQKTFAMSISSIHTNKSYSHPPADPYSFDEECEANQTQGKTQKNTSANHSVKKKSSKKPVTSAKLGNWNKLAATKNPAFSWDEDDDNESDAEGSQESRREKSSSYVPGNTFSWNENDDNDADAEGSQESGKEKSSSYLPLKAYSPDPKQQRQSNLSQKQTLAYRQVHSQLSSCIQGDFGPRRGRTPSSCPQERGRFSKREKKQDSWSTPVSTKTLNSKGNRNPGEEESPYNDSVGGSPASLKPVKHKAHPYSDQRTKRMKQKSVTPVSTVGSAFSLPCVFYKTSERGSYSGTFHTNPKGKSSSMTASAGNREDYSPLDITSVISATAGWTASRNLSDGDGRSSVKRKAIDKEQYANSQPSPSMQTKSMEALDRLEVVGEISPSYSQTSVPVACENNTPVSRLSRKTGKLPQGWMKGETAKKGSRKKGDTAKKGLLCDSLPVSRPSEGTLNGEHECDYNVESGDDDEITSLFTKSWGCQSEKLFPDLTDSPPVLLTGTSQRKRKPQLSATQPPEKASRKTSSKSGLAMSIETLSQALSDDDDILDLEQGTQPGTNLRVTQPVTGITSLLQGFGVDMQKQMKDRETLVQELAKGALKSSSRHICNLWTMERSKRGEVFINFKDRMHSELCDLEQDVAMMTEMEKSMEATYLKQLNILHEQREKLQKRVNSVKECHEDFRMETEQVEDHSHEARRCLEVQMKQDMDQLKNKLLLSMQQQQLKRVKDSFLKHFI